MKYLAAKVRILAGEQNLRWLGVGMCPPWGSELLRMGAHSVIAERGVPKQPHQ